MLMLIDLTPMLKGGENGGAKWFVLELLQRLPAHMPGWTFALLTTAGNDAYLAELFPSFSRYCIINERGELRPVNPAGLPGGERAALLFCPFTAPFHAVPQVPTVSVLYDLQFDAYPMFFTPGQIAERRGHVMNAAAVCARVVSISHFSRDHFLAFTGYDPARADVVHITIPQRVQEQNGEALAGLGLEAGRYLLYPANTWPHKNHMMLLTAFSLWCRQHPESALKLVCTGVGDQRSGQELKEAVERMGLGGRVIFPGFLSEQDLGAVLAKARALIFPSLFEGFGMPLVEAMAAGVPVLCSNTTSLPEVGGDAVLFFDPRKPETMADAISRIESEPGLAEALVARGHAQVKALGTADDMAAAYAAILSKVQAEFKPPVAKLRPPPPTLFATWGAALRRLFGRGA